MATNNAATTTVHTGQRHRPGWCRFNVTEAVEDDVDILELRGGGAEAQQVSAKRKAAQETVAAPAADNTLATKAAAALQALAGLSGDVLPDAQERPVRPAPRVPCLPCMCVCMFTLLATYTETLLPIG